MLRSKSTINIQYKNKHGPGHVFVIFLVIISLAPTKKHSDPVNSSPLRRDLWHRKHLFLPSQRCKHVFFL